jgi:acyl carrier protein
MAKEQYTREQLVDIIKELLPTDKDISESSKYIEDLGLDSLEMVDLIMEFEDKFGFDIPEEAAEAMASVADSIDYILEQQTEKA